jgi:hypothetical protein
MSDDVDRDASFYCAFMRDIRDRLELIQAYGIRQSQGELRHFDAEACCLQFRKTLEGIAFASLCSNRLLYERSYPQFHNHWKAKQILAKIGEINRNFFPVPIRSESPRHFGRIREPYLSQEQFAELYDLTSEVIHTWNPYRPEPRIVDFKKPISEWFALIYRLLNFHYCHVAGTDKLLLAELQSSEDGEVRVHLASRAPS